MKMMNISWRLGKDNPYFKEANNFGIMFQCLMEDRTYGDDLGQLSGEISKQC